MYYVVIIMDYDHFPTNKSMDLYIYIYEYMMLN